jgi:hypothetical protein
MPHTGAFERRHWDLGLGGVAVQARQRALASIGSRLIVPNPLLSPRDVCIVCRADRAFGNRGPAAQCVLQPSSC